MIKEAWRGLIDFVQDINTTSARILVSVILATIVTICVLVMMFLETKIEIVVLGALFAFILSLGGLDVIQYSQKRKTFIPDASTAPDVSTTVTNRALGDDHSVEFTP